MGEVTSAAGGSARRHRGPALFTIPHQRPFAAALAAGLMARYPDPLERARLTVLLPSGRSVRALADALIAAADGRATLLPRMSAIAHVDEDEALGRFAEGGEAVSALPPAMPALARTLALATLLAPVVEGGPASALAQAEALARVLDQLAMHGVRVNELADVPLEDAAGHWQRSRAILARLAADWPALVTQRGLMTDVDRRERLLQALADRWQAALPAAPLWAAGFAAAPPAVARLLAVVARLPRGLVILPGLEPAMDADLVDAVRARAGATHPHHGMLAMLDVIGAAPAEVAHWPHGTEREVLPARAVALSRAMLPAALADRWQQAARTNAPDEALSGMALLVARGPEQEALAVALAMRRQLETPGSTAALVTPSRALARRVAAALGRFGLVVDDSAGEPLALRPRGVLVGAMVAAAAARLAPVPLLALLKHPLARPDDRAAWLARVRQLDLALRGLPPKPGLDGIASHLARQATQARFAALPAWWEADVAPVLQPLDGLFAGGTPSLAALLKACRTTGDALTGPAFWQGQDGHALGSLVAAIESAPDAAALALPAEAAAHVVAALLGTTTVRPPWRQHARLAIWGPLEARLQTADLMILGGMNEGVWPAEPTADPWLAPAVRRALGLPPPEARIGLMAHDLMGALAARQILFTRAEREGGSSTIPSRFLARIAAALGPLPPDRELEAALLLDGGDAPQRARRPAPVPPATVRPRRLSVTDADMLAADPFSFYAKRILALSELDPLEQEADAAVRGTAVHRIAERFALNPLADPVPLIDAELAKLGDVPALSALWRPRLVRMLDWLRDQLVHDAADGWSVASVEHKASLVRHGIELVGKADRIDRNSQGQYRILDYKTGAPPAKLAFEEGHARQLPLLRLLVEAGGAEGLPAGVVAGLLYVKLSGGSTTGKIEGAGWTADRAAFEADLDQLLGQYLLGDAPFRAKLNKVYATRYRSFDHLARLEEWIGRA